MPEPTTPPLNSPHGRAHDARLPAVLVVIPSFNCAPLLPRSVHSAYALRGCAPRVVVVDDGSTDDTPEVLRTLQLEHPDLVVLRKPNGGLSSARNHGIAYGAANGLGDYLLLLDADDVLLPVDLGPLLAGGHDMVRIGVEEVREGEQRILHHAESLGPMSGRSYLENRFAAQAFYTPSWAYLYRMDWLCATSISFTPGLLHEDMLFTVQALLRATDVCAFDALLYRYIRRPGSITAGADDEKRIRRVRSLGQVLDGLMREARMFPTFDLRPWAEVVVDYADSIATRSTSRRCRWLAFAMQLRYMLRYRGYGGPRVRFGDRARAKRLWRHFFHNRILPGASW